MCEIGIGNDGVAVKKSLEEPTYILFRNSTHETWPCLRNECQVAQEPGIRNSTVDSPNSTTASTLKSNTENITTNPNDDDTIINSTFIDSRSKSGRNGATSMNTDAVQVNPTSTQGSEIWIGFIIGLVTSMIIILLLCFVITRRKKSVDSDSRWYWPITRLIPRYHPRRSNTHTLQLNTAANLTSTSASNTNSSGEYLQPTLMRYSGVGPAPIPPPPLPNGTISSTNESTYCVVPSPIGTIDPVNRLNAISINPHRQLTRQRAQRNTPNPTDDPIYSDIPAYDRQLQQRSVGGPSSVSGLEQGMYPSSEFDSSESESSIDNQISHSKRIRNRLKDEGADSGLSSRMNDDREQDLKSCYSDEGRDVVNTLRRPSRKGRFSRQDYDEREEDIRSGSDEELRLLEDEFQNETMSAYTARYSKPHLKKNKDDISHYKYQPNNAGGRRRIGSDSPPLVHQRHPLPVNPEFQWIRGNSGRRPPQTSSPSQGSTMSSGRLQRQDSMEVRD